MKNYTDKFRKTIKQMGRQFDFFVTYTENNENHILEGDKLIRIAPHYEANLLKSAMKELEFETTELIPKNTIVNAKFGIQVNNALTVMQVNQMKVNRLNEIKVNMLSSALMGFEYIDFGNYIIKDDPTYNADTQTYTYQCYDKMLYSMKDYESLGVTYPITVRNYIKALCNKIGLQFKNKNGTFANYNRKIQNELYIDTDGNNLGYTYRDVLDELAQVTASIICINEKTDELEIRYPNQTNDTIDEEFLKDVNVEFKEKYGPINVIVLSRSGGSDNIYYPNVLPENPCEIKISDNQIMNFNDRSDYLPDIYNKLNGLEYFINDYSSTGILWYELGDMYNISIGNDTYNCLMLNDEINIEQGLEETIYTDMPEESETDYTKADKTDRKINQTNLIVDKQNQQIQSVVSQIGDRSEKQTTITQDIDGINSKVEELEDVTEEAQGITQIELQNCVEGPLLGLNIYGNNSVFSYTYPSNNLYPSNTLYPHGDSRIVVTDKDGNSKTYELGVLDVLRQNGNVRDEYVLEKGKAKVIRRINKDGTIKIQEEVEGLGEINISLSEGTNTIRIQNYNANIKAKFAIQNDYTDVFATKVEMNSSITQTAEEINLEVRKKVDENEIISKINQSAEEVSIEAEKISLSGKTLNLADNMAIVSNNFNVDKDGNMTCNGATMSEININEGRFRFSTKDYSYPFVIYNIDNPDRRTRLGDNRVEIADPSLKYQSILGVSYSDTTPYSAFVACYGPTSQTIVNDQGITTPTLSQTSLEKNKKNIKEFLNGLDTIKNINIYTYNLNNEDNNTKKHIGFVIGDKYKYSKEVTSKNNDGVDLYSFISVCCKAIQEQQEEIEELQNKIKEMEGKNE